MKLWPAASAVAFCLGQRDHRGVGAGRPHQAFAGRLAEGEAELDAGDGADQRFVNVFDRLDEWVWPRMKFVASGLSMRTVVSCMAISLPPAMDELRGSHGPLRPKWEGVWLAASRGALSRACVATGLDAAMGTSQAGTGGMLGKTPSAVKPLAPRGTGSSASRRRRRGNIPSSL